MPCLTANIKKIVKQVPSMGSKREQKHALSRQSCVASNQVNELSNSTCRTLPQKISKNIGVDNNEISLGTAAQNII